MSLSSLIVQREIASIREIEEALARQVLYGGDFVTNLFEVSRIDESELMPIVAESFGLPAAPSGELPRAPVRATRLVAADVAAERSIAPLEVGRSLIVAVAEPLSADAAQELAFALALPIEQRIAPLFRIRQALARDYGVPLDKRTARLITKVVMNGPGVSSTVPPPFESSPLYRAAPRPPSFAPPPPRGADLQKTLNTVQGTLVRKTEIPPPRAVKRHRGPLTSDLAKAELDAAVDRDVVFDLLFEFTRQFFDYTAVFIVQGEVAEGRDSFGEGATRDKVARLRVPFDQPSVLTTAYSLKQLVRQRPSKDGLDRILMNDLGREGATECVVFPVIVRKRVVALLLGDGGNAGIDVEGVAQVNALIALAANAFERVIMRRKLKGAEGANEGAAPHARRPSERQIPAVQPNPEPSRRSDRPTSEELAQPIRDLLDGKTSAKTAIHVDPARAAAKTTLNIRRESPVPGTRHDPAAAGGALADPSTVHSDRPPPPANLLAVRRPSGRPIPREEPANEAKARASDPTRPKPRSEDPLRRTTKSQSFRRAEAPPLDFGTPKAPGIITTEEITAPPPRRRSESPLSQTLVNAPSPFSQTLGSAPSPFVNDTPFASSSPAAPPPTYGTPITDMSPQPIVLPDSFAVSAPDVQVQPIIPKVTLDADEPSAPMNFETTLTSGLPILPPPERVEEIPQPITPLVVVTPDQEIKPIPIHTLVAETTPLSPGSPGVSQSELPDSPNGAEPVLALATRKASLTGIVIPPEVKSAMPLSEQQVSVPAHKPPSSRGDSSPGLPSVIVDVGSEFATIVDRVVERQDEEAEAALLRAGGYAMPAIMARFPGPIVVETDRLEHGALPRVAECGPVIRLIASQRRTALPFVLALVDNPDIDTRFWATYLITELVYPDAVDAAIARTVDDAPRVRRAARAAARALAEAHPQLVVERLAELANRGALAKRIQAIEALAETREPAAVAAILPQLEDASDEIVAATRGALLFLTQQDFGRDTERWLGWWQDHRQQHRLEWLIDALMHDQRAIRATASEELRSITKEYFGYYDDLPKRERERAQGRYREWWESIGRVRFSRAANRGAL